MVGVTNEFQRIREEDPQHRPVFEIFGEQAARGAAKELDTAHTEEALRDLLDKGIRQMFRSLEGRGVPGAPSGAGVGGSGEPSPVAWLAQSVTHEVAHELAMELQTQLGPQGEGPLGTSLEGVAKRSGESVIMGIRAEIATIRIWVVVGSFVLGMLCGALALFGVSTLRLRRDLRDWRRERSSPSGR